MSIQRQQRIDSFPVEVRDYNMERCARWASDFFNVGDFVESTGGTPAGTISYAAEYSTSNQTTGVVDVGIPSTAAAGTRSGIRDATTAALNVGYGEMDYLARCRLVVGAPNAGDVYARIGFFDSQLAAQTAARTQSGLFFDRKPAETTWRASVCKDFDGTNGIQRRYDTGIPVGSWSKFGIWVSAAGDKAIFSVNDVVVHVESTDFPTTLTPMRAEIHVQATGTVTTAYVLKCDYMQFRIFPRRYS